MKIIIDKNIVRKIKLGRIPLGMRAPKIFISKKIYNRKKGKSIPKE